MIKLGEPAGRASELAWRALDPDGKASEQVRRASKKAATLVGPRIKLGETWSQLGGPQSLLGGPQNQLGGPTKPAGRFSEPGGRPPGKGGGQRQNRAFIICGGTIGHRPLRGRCPKTNRNRLFTCSDSRLSGTPTTHPPKYEDVLVRALTQSRKAAEITG